MLDLAASNRFPLSLASPLLSAPGVWVAGALPTDALGALVTPPLGRAWDGQAATWEARPGALVWAPPRRELERFLRQHARQRHAQLPLFTLAPDAPGEIERAFRLLEGEEAAGFLLWDATPATVAAAKRSAPALPVLAEFPCTEVQSGKDLVAAGADGLWVGPPRAGAGGQRLWGAAVLPLVLAALAIVREEAVPLVAGTAAASAEDALRLIEAGATAIALDPAWWVEPGLAAAMARRLASSKAGRSSPA